MICSEDRKNVRKFLEDLLDEAEYQRVRRHMENCGACTQFAHTAGSVSSMLMEMGHFAGTEDLVENVLFEYEKRRREGARMPEPLPAPPAVFSAPPVFSAPAVPSNGLKFLIVAVVLVVAGLAWRDWVQTRLLESVLRSGVPATAAQKSVPPALSAPAAASAIRGDFEWGNTRVHWSQGGREAVSDLVRRFSPDIRYEAPGMLVVHVAAGRDAEWKSALQQLPGVLIEEDSAGPGPESDQLYTIDYQGS